MAQIPCQTVLLGLLIAAGFAIVTVASGALLQNVGKFQKSVEVTDGNNVLRAVMFADDNRGKSGFEIRDPKGNVRLEIHTNQNDDPFMQFFDVNGKERLNLGIGQQGEAYLVLRRGDGTIVHRFVAPN